MRKVLHAQDGPDFERVGCGALLSGHRHISASQKRLSFCAEAPCSGRLHSLKKGTDASRQTVPWKKNRSPEDREKRTAHAGKTGTAERYSRETGKQGKTLRSLFAYGKNVIMHRLFIAFYRPWDILKKNRMRRFRTEDKYADHCL